MPEFLVNTTPITCSMGTTPTVPFTANPLPGAPTVNGLVVATVDQVVMGANIAPFGQCNSVTNPAVILATAAAQGVHTPAPCTPAVALLWTQPSACAKLGALQFATAGSQCFCTLGGQISVQQPIPSPVQTT